MKRSIWLAYLSFAIISAQGQDISRQESDSMLKALSRNQPTIDRIDLLLNLAQFHIYKPGEEQIDFDSALVYINEAAVLNRTLQSSDAYGYGWLTLSILLKEKGRKEESRKLVEKAVKILTPGNNKYYLGKALYEMSWYIEPASERIDLLEQSVEAFRQAGKLDTNPYCLLTLAELYSANGVNAKAIETYKQAAIGYQRTNPNRLKLIYVELGEAYRLLGNEGQGLSFMLKALKAAKLAQDSSMDFARINSLLGSLYFRIDRKELAVGYLKDALEIAKKHRNEIDIWKMARNLSIVYNYLGQPDQALKTLASIPKNYWASKDTLTRVLTGFAYLKTYLALKQYDNARRFCDSLIKLEDERSWSLHMRWMVYNNIGSYYFYTKQYEKARVWLSKITDTTASVDERRELILNAQLRYELDSAQKNYQAAFHYLLYYKTKMDSVFSANREKQFQVLGVEYETEMKEDSIRLGNQDITLLTQKNSLQQANLQKANLIRNVTIGGIVLTLLVSGLLYRQYRQKQKNNDLITRKNDQLQHLLSEKEWLLKEIHHRVKNNLQIVMSLLNSQSAYIDNESALTAIHDSQHRVHAMSLIHQKLYGSENVSTVDMSIYIRELVTYLADSFNTRQRIHFELKIEPLEMDVSQAVPLGLILNEAITNSIKYAFPDERRGAISILLSTNTPGHYVMKVSDNGIGLPSHFNTKKKGSLGISLMQGLTEDLSGNLSIQTSGGTSVEISFIQDVAVKRPRTLPELFGSHN